MVITVWLLFVLLCMYAFVNSTFTGFWMESYCAYFLLCFFCTFLCIVCWSSSFLLLLFYMIYYKLLYCCQTFGMFPVWTTLNNAAMNILMHFWWCSICILGCIPRSTVARPRICISSALLPCCFPKWVINSHSH